MEQLIDSNGQVRHFIPLTCRPLTVAGCAGGEKVDGKQRPRIQWTATDAPQR
jgi:hypothetical protein